MAKKKTKSGGSTAKSGGNSKLVLLGLLGGGLYLLTKGNSAASTTAGGATYVPTGSGSGSGSASAGTYDNSPISTQPTTSVGTSLPTSVPTSLPTGTPTTSGGVLLDNWGVPHFRADTVDFANGFGNDKGALWKAISDRYGLYYEEIDLAVQFDHEKSGNSYNQAEAWWRADTSRFQNALDDYNAANPGNRIIRRA